MRFGLATKFLGFLLLVFLLTGYGVLHYQSASAIKRCLSEKKKDYEEAARRIDEAVTDVLEVSSDDELGLLVNAAAKVADARVVLTDARGLVLYDTELVRKETPTDMIKTMRRGEKATDMRFYVVLSNGNGTEYVPLDKAGGKLRGARSAEFHLVAPLYQTERSNGFIVLRGSLEGLRSELITLANHTYMFLSIWFVVVAAAFFILLHRMVLHPVGRLAEIAQKVANKDFSERADFPHGDEISLLGKAFNTMVYNVEKDYREAEERNEGLVHMSSELELRNQELQRKQKLIDSDLRLAHQIQQELMPQVYPRIEGLRIAAANFQVGEIGGDCFDLYKLGEKRLAAFIGDVSGKGISAALVMAMATILFSQIKDRSTYPDEILSKVNDVMHRHFGKQHSIYLTCFFLIIDVEAMTITFSCAGHNPPFIYRKDESKVISLVADGFGLGMFAGVNYERKTVGLKPGDKVVLYTDGVVECRNIKGEMLGFDRFVEMVRAYPDANSYQLTHNIIEDIGRFAGTAKRADDLTLFVVEIEA
ncbi:MAG: SpoIIE family protein phosphatase [bacterium]